jgi:magnesium chelatase family protein
LDNRTLYLLELVRVLEALRLPLEDKVISNSRAQGSMTFQASLLLVGAMHS